MFYIFFIIKGFKMKSEVIIIEINVFYLIFYGVFRVRYLYKVWEYKKSMILENNNERVEKK